MLRSTDERCLPLLRPITLLDCRTVHSLEHNSDNFSQSNLSTPDIVFSMGATCLSQLKCATVEVGVAGIVGKFSTSGSVDMSLRI